MTRTHSELLAKPVVARLGRLALLLLAAAALLLAVAPLLAEEQEQTPAGIEQPGGYYRGYAYQGDNPLVGQGKLAWRWGEGVNLFSNKPHDAQAWTVSYRTALEQRGLSVAVNASQADPALTGASALGIAAGDLGLARSDYRASWKAGSFNLSLGRDEARNAVTSGGLNRESYEGGAFGAWYRRERLAIDSDLKLESAAHDRLLSTDGLGLGGRKLESGAGYTDLNALGGLQDRFESIGWQHDKLSVAGNSRVLELNGARISDWDQKLGFGPLSLSRAARSVDANFVPLRQAGYSSLSWLSGGREDRDTVALNLDVLDVTWNKAHVTRPDSPSASEERAVTLRPFKGWSVGYDHSDKYDSTATKSDRVELSVAHGPQQVGLHAESSVSGAEADREVYRRLEASYQYEKALKVTYAADQKAKAGIDGDQTHSATFETGVGLTGSGRVELHPDGADGWYHGVKLQRDVVPAWHVNASYDAWRHTSDSNYEIAGRKRVLQSGVDWALAYTMGTTLQPGPIKVDAEFRSLRWQQPDSSSLFEPGLHLLTETSVSLTQELFWDLRARGDWAVYEKDLATDRERREAALALVPGGKTPAAEIGYRQVRQAGAEAVPAVFASAHIGAWPGMSVEGEVAQSAAGGNRWSAPEQRAIKVAASQKFWGDGEARVEWNRTPLAARTASDPPSALGHDLTVALATPSGFVFDGLKVSGRYHTRSEDNDPVGGLTVERSATLKWENPLLGNLSATYTQSGRQGSALSVPGQSRVALEYAKSLREGGQLVLSAWLDDVAQRTERQADKERYRLGLHYDLKW